MEGWDNTTVCKSQDEELERICFRNRCFRKRVCQGRMSFPGCMKVWVEASLPYATPAWPLVCLLVPRLLVAWLCEAYSPLCELS